MFSSQSLRISKGLMHNSYTSIFSITTIIGIILLLLSLNDKSLYQYGTYTITASAGIYSLYLIMILFIYSTSIKYMRTELDRAFILNITDAVFIAIFLIGLCLILWSYCEECINIYDRYTEKTAGIYMIIISLLYLLFYSSGRRIRYK